MKIDKIMPGSFRDPSGFVFCANGTIYRQVNAFYKCDYDQLIDSGLYDALICDDLLISHAEASLEYAQSGDVYKIITPEPLSFISYPYEWCFSQLLDAALITLKVQKKSLDFGMSLKDCSAFNVQFRKGKPVFIDTLSFERYCEGRPWIAYRQFCQHFLAPLAIMSHSDIRLSQLLRAYMDGIPLDLASSLLPLYTYLDLSLLTHIHLHSKSQKHFAGKSISTNDYKMGRLAFIELLNNLERAIRRLKWRSRQTEWNDYYNNTNYSSIAFQHKKQIVLDFLDKVNPNSIWDLGANVGTFSRLASGKGRHVISFDIDPATVEENYLKCIKEGETSILPLLLDVANPSPGIGWENMERMSLIERGPADAVFALALVHHLFFSNNIPFSKMAEFFSSIGKVVILEFIPKSDTQVQGLLLNREDIFPHYTQHFFENEFKKYFIIHNSSRINGSERILYLMEKR